MGKRDTKGGLAGYYDSDVGFLSEPGMQDIWVPKYRWENTTDPWENITEA